MGFHVEELLTEISVNMLYESDFILRGGESIRNFVRACVRYSSISSG